jgi:hypothetical protein
MRSLSSESRISASLPPFLVQNWSKGCQIYPGTIYQHGKNVPNYIQTKCTKCP